MTENREDLECLPYLRALSDENRYRIVQLLASLSAPLTLGELAGRLKLSDYNASKHVRVLSESGIIQVKRKGRFKYISIDPEFLSRIRSQPGSEKLDLGCCKFDFGKPVTPVRGLQFSPLSPAFDQTGIPIPARYVMVGGFPGAGKTTAVAAIARHLVDSGKRVGLITNDQGRDSVDTQMLLSQGFATEEIAGGCFCCKFDSLLDATSRLTADASPEIIIAEPAGNCTDLLATVTYPLRRIHGESFTMAPLSVLVDPARARRILGIEKGPSFSRKIQYIFLKQLEEADIIVTSKCDLLESNERKELESVLETRFPQAKVIGISARTGEGLDPWFDLLEQDQQKTGSLIQSNSPGDDEAENPLGWLNATIHVEAASEIDASLALESLANIIRESLGRDQVKVAYLKMTLNPENALAGEVAIVNWVPDDSCPDLGQDLEEPITGGQIILNLRAEGPPETLDAAARAAVGKVSSSECTFTLDHLESFRPSHTLLQ